MESGDLAGQLDGHRAVVAALAQGEVARALAEYLEPANAPVRKPNLEWMLASVVIERGIGRTEEVDEADDSATVDGSGTPAAVLAGAAWPAERLAHPSGAGLRFVVEQTADGVEAGAAVLPPGLAALPTLPGWARRLVAEAWLRRPRCPALDNPDGRRHFAHWLAAHPAAAGTTLVAAAARDDDPALVSELAGFWLKRGLHHPAAPAQVALASTVPALAGVARRALPVCLGRWLDDDGRVIELLDVALRLEEAETVVAMSARLLRRPLEYEHRRRTLALRIAALADSRRRAEAAAEYRRLWMPAGWVYPWPERLLYVFQQEGEDDLARHLVACGAAVGDRPSWVRLTAELLAAGEVGEAHLEAWEEAYLSAPDDERVLVGATRAVLRAPLPLKRDWSQRLGLAARWERLAGFDGYREVAGAFLVLLRSDDDDRIAEFDRRLAGVPLASPPARAAARAWIQALRRNKRWHRLRGIEAADDGRVARACSFSEWELVRVLSRLETLPPPDRRAERAWCEGWERAIGQPLAPDEAAEVLDHFVNLRRAVEAGGGLRHEHGLFADVTLQLLRRGKAAAESLLARAALPETDRGALRRRLAVAGPEATLRVLQELLVGSPANPVAALV